MPERFLGQTIGGRYRITRFIGAGAYAWVYEALDAELEIPVAVKLLRPEHTGKDVTEARFRREATTAARLRHPNIVTIRDVGRADDITWVVMDLVPGSLSRRLQLLPSLPETEVVRLGIDVAAALATAHAAGIIHRDIKPDNILFGAAGEAIVCDFGLARALESGADLSATNQVVGTPHYFSPEQARGEALDGRSDLYALGVSLFRAATGRLPFEGNDWYAVARQHVDAPPPDPRSLAPELSPAFSAILLKLLAKQPDQRFASAADLAEALAMLPTAPVTGTRLALPTAGTTAIHPVLPVRTAWWRRRAALVLFALATLTGFVWLAQGRPSPATVLARIWPPPAVLPDSLLQAPDSLTALGTDSAPVLPVALDSATDTTTVRKPTTAAPRLGTLRLEGPRGAAVRVNDVDVEVLPWELQRARAGQYVVRSRLVSGPGVNGCPYAEHVDTLQLRAGERAVHRVELARCVRLWVDVTPADARLALTDSLDQVLERNAAATAVPLLLRAGTWRIRAQAPRCITYDAVDTLRAGDDTVKIVMIC